MNAANAKLVQQKKSRKRNDNVFRVVNEFFIRIRDSSLLT